MASKRRLRRNTCGNKVKFPTKKDALDRALLVKRKTGTTRYVDAYKCKFCGAYHWGNS